MEPTLIGIDVSQDRLDVHVRPGGETVIVARNAAGLDQLVALETTGGCEVIAAAGLPVVVVNPAQIRAFARALGQRAKTDPIDAGKPRMLALITVARKLLTSSMPSSGTDARGNTPDQHDSRFPPIPPIP